jgi:ankyrin repeat protein
MYPKDLKKNFSSKDNCGYIAWHRAAVGGNLVALEELRKWAKKAEIKTDKFLLAQSGDGYTAFQMAAQNNHTETLRNCRSGLKKSNSIKINYEKFVSKQRQVWILRLVLSSTKWQFTSVRGIMVLVK